MKRKILLGCLGLLLALAGLGAWSWTPDLPRALLEQRYLREGSRMVTLAGTPVHLRDTGVAGGQPVILLHGFGSSLHSWDGWAEGLAAEFRVIALDLPGSGLSPPDATGDYTDARVMAILSALVAELELPPADLVGNSIGGRIAFHFAAAVPDAVRRLVLVAPDGFASPGFAYGTPPDVPAVLGLMRHVLPRSVLRSNLAVAFADPARLDEETVTRYHDLLRAPGARQAQLDRMAQTVLVDPEPALRALEAPVLLLWGAEDAMIPAAHAADYTAILPQARLVVLPGLGHVPQEEAPVLSLAPVREFLLQ